MAQTSYKTDGAAATAVPTTSLSEEAISAIIEERIRRGVYQPGIRVPAERGLASELGVSRRFVRMAYNRLTELGLLDKSHYRTPFVSLPASRATESRGGLVSTSSESPARAVRAAASPTIAAIIPTHPRFPGGMSIVAGIHKVLNDTESPYRLTFLDTFHADRTEVLRREAKAIRSAVDEGVAGLIWWYYGEESSVREVIEENPDIAIVFVDRHPHDISCDFAGIDDMESSRTAVEYLLDLGHRRIAHLMDPGSYSTIQERAAGYYAALRDRGIAVDDELIVHLDWDANRMERAVDRFFGLAQPPTALFTSNDFIAYEFIEAAAARGIRVPEDLSVVGHGNIDRYTPREFLTTIDQPFEMIGKMAAKLLLKRLQRGDEGRQTYQQLILQAPLLKRGSCRSLTESPQTHVRAANDRTDVLSTV